MGMRGASRAALGPHACDCGAAGMPCSHCNTQKMARSRACPKASRSRSTRTAGGIELVAEASAHRRQLTQPDANGRVVGPKAEITHRGPITRPPLTDFKTRTKVSHSLPPCDGRHH
jgi:hypothetical protein